MIVKSALFGLCALFAASSANAETLFDAFQTACIKADGSAAQVLSFAEAKGWEVMPQDQVVGISQKFGDAKGQFLGRFSRADRRAVLVGNVDAPASGQNFKMTFCVVAGLPDQGEPVRSEASAFAAIPANSRMPKDQGLYFAYTEQAGKHVQILNPEDDSVMLPLLKKGSPRVLVVMDQPGLAFLAYALPSKSAN